MQEDVPPSTHRRLMERKTLSPGAKATVLMANQMAHENAKGNREQAKEDQILADPFQGERDQDNQNNKVTKLDKEEEDRLEKLRKEFDWVSIDPLVNSNSKRELQLPKLDLAKPRVQYLGVAIDAARHYFPIEWLKTLIVYLHAMNYNLIQFRLSNDEYMALKFKSHPELATNTNTTSQEHHRLLYSPSELKELVAFARDHHITMIPELNLPQRAVPWAAIPGLMLPCPNFLCSDALHVPLNIEHPELPNILYDVLKEIIEIFEFPRMLHLGGSISLRDSDGCLEEAKTKGGTRGYTERFETILSSVLKKVSYPEEQVVRFETIMEDSDNNNEAEETIGRKTKPVSGVRVTRVGGIRHYAMSMPLEGSQKNKETLVTGDLNLGITNVEDAAYFYQTTREIVGLTETPKGIVVGSTLMSPEAWLERNALARLLAVSMGATAATGQETVSKEFVRTQFNSKYNEQCQKLLGKNSPFCQLNGHIVKKRFLVRLSQPKPKWNNQLCEKMTFSTMTRVFNPFLPDRNYADSMGNYVFWNNFHRLPEVYQPKSDSKQGSAKKEFLLPKELKKHKVEKAGVIFDLANSLVSAKELEKLLVTYVAPLGFNALQLRLSDDFAFAVQLRNNSRIAQSIWVDETNKQIPKLTELTQVVDAASEWGVEVFPEVSINTNAGGWVNGGYLVRCPKQYCKEGAWIPNDIREPMLLPLVYMVLWELQQTFGGSSPYIHLGADERVENLKCFEEAGLEDNEDPPFGAFEAKLANLLRMLGIQSEHVIRYDNLEQLSYEDRVGDITHYRDSGIPGELPDVRKGEACMMTVNLLSRSIYSIYKDVFSMTRGTPLAIMGEIRTLDVAIWKEQYMGARLIAVILGLSDSGVVGGKMLEKEAFIQKTVEICKLVNFPDYADDPGCQAVKELLESEKEVNGDDDAIDDLPPAYPVANKKFREQMCAENTREIRNAQIKDDILLKKRDDGSAGAKE